jgi:hypothetical protein
MDQSNWINLGLLAVAVIAAIFAALQVVEARKARTDAQDAATQSANSAANSAESHRRIADATEESNAIARDATKPKHAWEFVPLTAATIDQKWQAINRTGHHIDGAYITVIDPEREQWIQRDHNEFIPVEPDEALEFTFIRRLSSPTSLTVTVLWESPQGQGQQRQTTTIR